MNRFATSAAAAVLLMTSVAYAQTDSAAPDSGAPAANEPAPAPELPRLPSQNLDAGSQGGGAMQQMRSGRDFDDDDDDDDEDEAGESRRRGSGDGGGARAGRERGGFHGGGDHAMRGHPGWRMHHGGMGMGMGGQGAVFHFSRGGGGPSIVIRCAASDSTQDCVDAIMPMLDKVLQMRRGGADD